LRRNSRADASHRGCRQFSGTFPGRHNGCEVTGVVGTGVVDSEKHDIPAAVAAAQDADVAILALGGRSGRFGHTTTEGKGTGSAASIRVGVTKVGDRTGSEVVRSGDGRDLDRASPALSWRGGAGRCRTMEKCL